MGELLSPIGLHGKPSRSVMYEFSEKFQTPLTPLFGELFWNDVAKFIVRSFMVKNRPQYANNKNIICFQKIICLETGRFPCHLLQHYQPPTWHQRDGFHQKYVVIIGFHQIYLVIVGFHQICCDTWISPNMW